MAAEKTYRASLEAAARQDPGVLGAHQQISQEAELMDICTQLASSGAIIQGQVRDIRAAVLTEERELYKSS
jgi:hypothetical protein